MVGTCLPAVTIVVSRLHRGVEHLALVRKEAGVLCDGGGGASGGGDLLPCHHHHHPHHRHFVEVSSVLVCLWEEGI